MVLTLLACANPDAQIVEGHVAYDYGHATDGFSHFQVYDAQDRLTVWIDQDTREDRFYEGDHAHPIRRVKTYEQRRVSAIGKRYTLDDEGRPIAWTHQDQTGEFIYEGNTTTEIVEEGSWSLVRVTQTDDDGRLLQYREIAGYGDDVTRTLETWTWDGHRGEAAVVEDDVIIGVKRQVLDDEGRELEYHHADREGRTIESALRRYDGDLLVEDELFGTFGRWNDRALLQREFTYEDGLLRHVQGEGEGDYTAWTWTEHWTGDVQPHTSPVVL